MWPGSRIRSGDMIARPQHAGYEAALYKQFLWPESSLLPLSRHTQLDDTAGDADDVTQDVPETHVFLQPMTPSGRHVSYVNNFLVMPDAAENDTIFSNVTADLSAAISPSSTMPVPRDLFFNDDTMVSVVIYSVLFFVAACGNLTVFITLFRNRHRKSRVNLFIMHLSIADMIVTFVMIPMEIGWHVTVSWKAGDVGCRALMFLRPLGFYLSSFILVAISLDRYFAITHPMSINDADRRGKLMLLMAWLFSVIASIPQGVIFHVESHPSYPWFTQCVTFNFYPTPAHELAYNLFNMAALYGLPLLIIIISYTLILWEISKKSRESKAQTETKTSTDMRYRGTFRRSGIGRIEKARIRTLKMTVVIVLVFITCWTPYFVINAWFWFDKESAQKINTKVTRGLLIFAVSNSCVNPIVYGMFTHTFAREFKSMCWTRPRRKQQMLSQSSTPSNVRRPFVKRLEKHNPNFDSNPKGLSQPANDACAVIEEAVASQLGERSYLNTSNDSNSTISTCNIVSTRHISRGIGHYKNDFGRYLLL